MKAGFAKIDITPPLGAILCGYYHPRYADHVIEPLYATALAFSDRENTVLAISLDLLKMMQQDADVIRARIAEHVGVPFEAVFLACTHTHTGPVISEDPGFFPRDPEYYRVFTEKVCRAAAEAITDMKEAVASIARSDVEGITFVRRFRMKDGTSETNPEYGDERILHPIGEADKSVQLVKLQRPGAPDIAIVNYGNHPDVLGRTGICPDFPCFLRDTLEAALQKEADGKGVRVAFFTGAQGDISPADRINGTRCVGPDMSRHLGRTLAGAVLGMYTFARPVASDRVFYKQNVAHAAVAKGTPEELKIAYELQQRYLDQDNPWKWDFEGYPFDVAVARKFIRLEHREPVIPLNIVCVGFGDVVFVGLPGEPFCQIGRKIKEGSPFAMTMPCCNANGSEGYFPVDEALTEGGYEADSALFLPGVAPELVKVSLETLKELEAKG